MRGRDSNGGLSGETTTRRDSKERMESKVHYPSEAGDGELVVPFSCGRVQELGDAGEEREKNVRTARGAGS
jgi:hypothetical protein